MDSSPFFYQDTPLLTLCKVSPALFWNWTTFQTYTNIYYSWWAQARTAWSMWKEIPFFLLFFPALRHSCYRLWSRSLFSFSFVAKVNSSLFFFFSLFFCSFIILVHYTTWHRRCKEPHQIKARDHKSPKNHDPRFTVKFTILQTCSTIKSSLSH